jgi:predicted SAM-dependent methyltransferase
MADLSTFGDQSFDLIFNPPSTMFIPELTSVWQACYRILRPEGLLLTGFMNPDEFVFDPDALDNDGTFVVEQLLPLIPASLNVGLA